MNRITCVSNNTAISLQRQIASSGEGEVWETNQQGWLAKLYHLPTLQRARKLGVMVENPPIDPMLSFNHVSIVWPRDLLRDQQGKIVGFLMPQIRHSCELPLVYNPKRRKVLGLKFNWRYLHVTALNVAYAIKSIHEKGYILGDIKPENILVNDRALISIIDTDSFQVQDPNDGAVYRCTVGSEGFTPPELIGKDLSSITQSQEQDCFRLAVIIFQLLFGYHPFGTGQWVGPGEIPTQDALVEKGIWIYGGQGLLMPAQTTIPIDVLHPDLRALFFQCFNDGHKSPAKRPTATEWCQALRVAINNLAICTRVDSHIYNRGYGRCYWCDRAASLRLDIFDFAQPDPALTTSAHELVYSVRDIPAIVTQAGKVLKVVGQVHYTQYLPKQGTFLIRFEPVKSASPRTPIFGVMIYAQGLRDLERVSITLQVLHQLKGEYISVRGQVLKDTQSDGSTHFCIIIREARQLQVIPEADAQTAIAQTQAKLNPPTLKGTPPLPALAPQSTVQSTLRPTRTTTRLTKTVKKLTLPKLPSWPTLIRGAMAASSLAIVGNLLWIFAVSPYFRQEALKQEVASWRSQTKSILARIDALKRVKNRQAQTINDLYRRSQSLLKNINKPQELLAKRQALQKMHVDMVRQLNQQADRPLAQAVSWCTVVQDKPYPCLGSVSECLTSSQSTDLGYLCSSGTQQNNLYPTRKYKWSAPMANYESKFLGLCEQGFSGAGSRYCSSYQTLRDVNVILNEMSALENDIVASEGQTILLQEEKDEVDTQLSLATQNLAETDQEIQRLVQSQKQLQSMIRMNEQAIQRWAPHR